MITDEIKSRIEIILARLMPKTQHTVAIGELIEDGNEGIVITAVPGNTGFAFHLEAGFHFPLHTAAPGKCLLAWMAEDQRNNIIDQMPFDHFTKSTITDRAHFDAELKDVIAKGYGVDANEQLEGCHCVGVPVFDTQHHAVAALWTTGPATHLPLREFDNMARILRSAANEISQLFKTSRMPNRDHIHTVVEQAKSIIENNLLDPPHMENLAKNLYVSYSWFRSVFKEQTGMAPGEYHQHLRLEKAKELLKQSDLNIRQISEELGFTNQNHFSALFKRKTGMSPALYREQA